jgi:hypothetical protein
MGAASSVYAIEKAKQRERSKQSRQLPQKASIEKKLDDQFKSFTEKLKELGVSKEERQAYLDEVLNITEYTNDLFDTEKTYAERKHYIALKIAEIKNRHKNIKKDRDSEAFSSLTGFGKVRKLKKVGKSKNAWIVYLTQYRKAHPELSYKEAMKKAKCSYKGCGIGASKGSAKVAPKSPKVSEEEIRRLNTKMRKQIEARKAFSDPQMRKEKADKIIASFMKLR